MNEMNLKELLPPSDSAHWNPLIERVLNRTVYARESTYDVWQQIFRWAMPALAVAGIVAAVAWGVALTQLKSGSSDSLIKAEATTTADRMLMLASQSDIPTTTQLVALFGGIDEHTKP